MMNKNEHEQYLKLSSIPLRKMNNNVMPIGIASGCIIDYEGKRILLSVQHATGDMGDWAAEIKFESKRGTKLHPLGAMNFLKSFSFNNSVVMDVDFSYVVVPTDFKSFFQEIDSTGNILSETPRKVCKVLFDSKPNMDDSFGFSGQVMPKRISNYFITLHRIYTGLKYKGEQADYYVFELPYIHPGHEHFQGCSGAPIIDTKGNVVALVCRGDKSKNLIYGISLKKYQVAIDVTCGKLSRST